MSQEVSTIWNPDCYSYPSLRWDEEINDAQIGWRDLKEDKLTVQEEDDAEWQPVEILLEAHEGKQDDLKNRLQGVFDGLLDMQKIEDVDDEFTFRPTERAYIKTKLTIMEAHNRMLEQFPPPRIVSDGEGGLVADWLKNGRRVRLRFRADGTRQDYIYYQSDEIYDIEPATTDTLTKRLAWLLNV